ncbi:MAG: hypothetical protein F6K40_06795 [Okeania sp. SIO3I5]|uniref:hypothetical protein n=1 Tax=Okeania sp. SIO3I5 TaxID=2607805 RepID=UPI0013B6A9A2|nr:hypothetical protein [Okeania sp. SIO3I5]NEQ36009.1 hypothetical protein [Okeania sp. SIO3I5]
MATDISLKIQSIIEKRQPLAKRVEKVETHLTSLQQYIQRLIKERNNFIPQLNDSQTSEILQGINLPQIEQEITTNLTIISKLKARFYRQTLNIGVVGKPRQGKSKFLQTLTGLTRHEIPDGSGQHCTGVMSIIYHQLQAQSTTGKVYSHSQKSLLEEVIKLYYEDLSLGTTPQKFDDFINRGLPALPSNITNKVDQAKYEYLKRYKEHYPQYKDLFNLKPIFPITQEKIREYVAQDDVDGKQVYYNYLAVKKVEIKSQFPHSDIGQIAVVDLPGLGDTGVGDVERMIKVLSQDVDFVLFMRKPNPGGDYWDKDSDVGLYDKAQKGIPTIPLSRWSFLILNKTAPDSEQGDNSKNCHGFLDELPNTRMEFADCIIADCANTKETANVLEKILQYLTENITELDHKYALTFENKLIKLSKNLQAELEKASSALQQYAGDKRLFQKSFKQFWDKLTNTLQPYLETIELASNQTDETFQEEVNKVIENCQKLSSIPKSVEQIKKDSNISGSYTEAYSRYLHIIRTDLSKQFLFLDGKIQDSLDAVKSEIGRLLTDKVQLGGLTDLREIEFLKWMAEHIPGDLINLKLGFDTISDFNVSYAGIIQRQVRQHINQLNPDKKTLSLTPDLEKLRSEIEEILDPEKYNINKIMAQFQTIEQIKDWWETRLSNLLKSGNISDDEKIKSELLLEKMEKEISTKNAESSEKVLIEIQKIHQRVIDLCKSDLDKLLSEPKQLAYAMVAEFVDRILRAEDIKDDWEIFLDDEQVRQKVWPEFKTMANRIKIQRNWQSLVEQIMDINRLENMSFL